MDNQTHADAVAEVCKFLESIKRRPSLPHWDTAVPYGEISHPPLTRAMRRQLEDIKLSARRLRRAHPQVHYWGGSTISVPRNANGMEPATYIRMLDHYARQSVHADAFCRSAWDDYRAKRRKAGHQRVSAVENILFDWETTAEGDNGFAVWFVGLPGSGKTTLSTALYLRLFWCPSIPLVMIDNDMQRNRDLICAPALGHFYTIGGVEGKPDFYSAGRLQRMKQRAGMISRMSNGGIVIGASFCPLPAQRRMFANACHGRFVLVHVATPIEACKLRRAKEECYTDPEKDPGIADFVPPTLAKGDVPPDLTIDTASEPLWKSIVRIMRVLHERGWMGLPEYLRSQ